MKPIIYYRVFYVNEKGGFSLLETHQFGDPDNFFESMDAATSFIQENFDNSQTEGVYPATEKVDMVLVVFPVCLIQFKKNG